MFAKISAGLKYSVQTQFQLLLDSNTIKQLIKSKKFWIIITWGHSKLTEGIWKMDKTSLKTVKSCPRAVTYVYSHEKRYVY